MKNSLSITAVVLFVFVLASCKKDPITNVIDNDHHAHIHGHLLHFNFTHVVDAESLEMDTIKYTNAANNMYSVITCQYFISDIMLHYGDSTQLIDGAHYIDANVPSTLSYSPVDEVEEGMFDSITMVIGLDTVKGATGAFVNAPESTMAWPAPMGGGYHYMKLEGKYDSVGVTKNYNLHYGPTMGTPYFVRVTLPASSFTKESTNLDVNISVNINKWFSSPNTYDFNVYGEAIMGNMAAQMVVKQNASDVFSVTSIEE